jgi:molybdopterin/thiamine biosynthesis adenylyltransferase
MFFTSRYHIRIATRKLVSPDKQSTVTDRQERIDGFDQSALGRATGILVGAGGIGSEIGEGLMRKGMGCLKIFDSDEVDWTNLNRQFFFKRDIGKKKGVRLAKNLAPHATCGTVLEGYGWSLQDAVAMGLDLRGSFAVVGVDNGKTRVEASQLFRKLGMPAIFIAVDLQAEAGYVLVQEPGKACFGCVFPKTMYGRKAPCRTPACKDILKAVAAFAIYAIDSVIMDRKRNWNYRLVHLAGFAPSHEALIERLPDCPLCGSPGETRCRENQE